MNLYVGNLNFNTSENELRQVFEKYGEVSVVNIIKDKYSGRSKGFAFVDMTTDEAGKTAIESLNKKEINGRTMKVSEAIPKK